MHLNLIKILDLKWFDLCTKAKPRRPTAKELNRGENQLLLLAESKQYRYNVSGNFVKGAVKAICVKCLQVQFIESTQITKCKTRLKTCKLI